MFDKNVYQKSTKKSVRFVKSAGPKGCNIAGWTSTRWQNVRNMCVNQDKNSLQPCPARQGTLCLKQGRFKPFCCFKHFVLGSCSCQGQLAGASRKITNWPNVNVPLMTPVRAVLAADRSCASHAKREYFKTTKVLTCDSPLHCKFNFSLV